MQIGSFALLRARCLMWNVVLMGMDQLGDLEHLRVRRSEADKYLENLFMRKVELKTGV